MSSALSRYNGQRWIFLLFLEKSFWKRKRRPGSCNYKVVFCVHGPVCWTRGASQIGSRSSAQDRPSQSYLKLTSSKSCGTEYKHLAGKCYSELLTWDKMEMGQRHLQAVPRTTSSQWCKRLNPCWWCWSYGHTGRGSWWWCCCTSGLKGYEEVGSTVKQDLCAFSKPSVTNLLVKL